MMPGSSETVTAGRDLSDADAAELWEKLPDGLKADIGAWTLTLALASEAMEDQGARPDLVGEFRVAVVKGADAMRAALDWLRRHEPKREGKMTGGG